MEEAGPSLSPCFPLVSATHNCPLEPPNVLPLSTHPFIHSLSIYPSAHSSIHTSSCLLPLHSSIFALNHTSTIPQPIHPPNTLFPPFIQPSIHLTISPLPIHLSILLTVVCLCTYPSTHSPVHPPRQLLQPFTHFPFSEPAPPSICSSIHPSTQSVNLC